MAGWMYEWMDVGILQLAVILLMMYVQSLFSDCHHIKEGRTDYHCPTSSQRVQVMGSSRLAKDGAVSLLQLTMDDDMFSPDVSTSTTI